MSATTSAIAGDAVVSVAVARQDVDVAHLPAAAQEAEGSSLAALQAQRNKTFDASLAAQVALQQGRMTPVTRVPPACPRGHSVSQAVAKRSPRASRCGALTEFGTALPGSPSGGQCSPPKAAPCS